jgi:preprotein translocase subunit SecF
MEVGYSQAADLQKVRGTISGLGYTDIQVQNFGTSRDVIIRLPAQKGVSSAQQSEKALAALKAADPSVSLRRTSLWARRSEMSLQWMASKHSVWS